MTDAFFLIIFDKPSVGYFDGEHAKRFDLGNKCHNITKEEEHGIILLKTGYHCSKWKICEERKAGESEIC
jgi:hypothetical protein